jgi:uroporphyrinogen-III synthase
MYRTISKNVKEIFANHHFDVICFFTPSGVKSLLDNYPAYKQNGTLIGTFGVNTQRAIEEAGLQVNIKAPTPQAPSMAAALDKFLSETLQK